jgi:hypothetical protein
VLISPKNIGTPKKQQAGEISARLVRVIHCAGSVKRRIMWAAAAMQTVQTISYTQYLTREDAMSGDRITNREGRLGTVVEVRSMSNDIGYGELSIKWDDGVVAINYARTKDFALISRPPQQV